MNSSGLFSYHNDVISQHSEINVTMKTTTEAAGPMYNYTNLIEKSLRIAIISNVPPCKPN